MIWSGPADQFHCTVPVGKTEVKIICLVSPLLRTWMVKYDRDGGWRGKFTGISPPRQPAVPSALRYKFEDSKNSVYESPAAASEVRRASL